VTDARQTGCPRAIDEAKQAGGISGSCQLPLTAIWRSFAAPDPSRMFAAWVFSIQPAQQTSLAEFVMRIHPPSAKKRLQSNTDDCPGQGPGLKIKPRWAANSPRRAFLAVAAQFFATKHTHC